MNRVKSNDDSERRKNPMGERNRRARSRDVHPMNDPIERASPILPQKTPRPNKPRHVRTRGHNSGEGTKIHPSRENDGHQTFPGEHPSPRKRSNKSPEEKKPGLASQIHLPSLTTRERPTGYLIEFLFLHELAELRIGSEPFRFFPANANRRVVERSARRVTGASKRGEQQRGERTMMSNERGPERNKGRRR